MKAINQTDTIIYLFLKKLIVFFFEVAGGFTDELFGQFKILLLFLRSIDLICLALL